MSHKRQHTFQEVISQLPQIKGFYCNGLQALKKQEREKVDVQNSRRLTGSICLDEAIKKDYPNSERWDYGIGHRHKDGRESVTWVEFHPASSSHVTAVLSKLRWLKEWLAQHGEALRTMTDRYCWVATGRILLPRHSPQIKRLAKEGLARPTSRLVLE